MSVVIATYNSPPELDDLVASLDAQTMPAEDYEIVFVDDGSSDQTYERLQAISSSRRNVVLDRIPNSGWPGRPRNVGTKVARGEYVFYSDHDDYLFPEALERMYDFAVANDLDVVHPKEVVQGWSSPGWATWRTQQPRLKELDQTAVQCISPHKLYRKSFLFEKEVWFPEGRVRLEDFSFNGLAWSRTDAIGLLANYPCYRWHLTDDNSHKKGYDFEVYWKSYRDSLEPILTGLPAGEKQDHLLIRWYRSRILERVAPQFCGYTDEFRIKLMEKFRELLPLFPAHLDEYLSPADRARSALLRRDDMAGLLELANFDTGIRLSYRDVTTRWTDGALEVAVVMEMLNRDGHPFAVEQIGDRVLRSVPDSLRHGLEAEIWDLTDALRGAFAEIVIRSRRDNVDWILKSKSRVEIASTGETDTIRVHLSALIDPRTAALGNALAEDVWDIYGRVLGFGYTATQRIPATESSDSTALVDGTPTIVFRTNAGFLAMDLEGQARSFVAACRPRAEDLEIESDRSRILLGNVHVVGITNVAGSVTVGSREWPATLVGQDGAASVRIRGALTGQGDVRVNFLGRQSRVLFALKDSGGARGPAQRIKSRLGAALRRARRAQR